MSVALLIVDVQNDFTEGGSLGAEGGNATAAAITEFVRQHRGDYTLVVASRDWHDATGNNGGHFSETPDYVDSWPPHCVAGTPGADYNRALDTTLIDAHVRKGQGAPAYSAFEGTDDAGNSLGQILAESGVTDLHVVGIATDYCVRASALDAHTAGFRVTVFPELCVGIGAASSIAAIREMSHAGVRIIVGSPPDNGHKK